MQVYVLSSSWWRKWATFVDYIDECTMYRTLPDNTEEDSDVPQQPSLSFSQECTSPGPVDNSDLFKAAGAAKGLLKNKLKELKDFVLVPSQVWSYLRAWYGVFASDDSLVL